MDRDLYEIITYIADERYRKWRSQGVYGQLVKPQDDYEWWIAEAAYELGQDHYNG